jgi:iron complex transport system ATP-binding protein
MIRAVDLTVGYRQGRKTFVVQQQLQLEAPGGAFITLIGPNGCGKSTLLRTLAGLQKPLGGEVFLQQENDLQQNIVDLSLAERSRLLGLVLTETVRLPHMTVYQLVAMGRHPYTTFSGRLGVTDREMIERSLEMVHLEGFAHRQVSELSDGERQRVLIAKALAQDTPLIFLDEPTSFLDLPNRIEIMLLLKKLSKEMGKTILISTHEIDLAIRVADLIWLMEPQKPVRSGSPQVLLANGSIQAVFHADSFGFDPDSGRVIIF